MAQISFKKILSKILIRLSEPYIKCINVSGAITDTTSGWKDFTTTVSIPQGYEVLPNCRPVSLYVSGDAKAYFTDRAAVAQSGNVISLRGWVYNPNAASNLTYNATVLLRRVGDAPIDPNPSQPFVQMKTVMFGPYTVAAGANLQINTYDACVQACPSGYTYVGVAGFSSNHGSVLVLSARPINSQYAFEAKNVGTGQASVQPAIYALYVRNT